MPYRSDAQRRFFNAVAGDEIPQETVNEWNDKSRGLKLPEHVKKKEKKPVNQQKSAGDGQRTLTRYVAEKTRAIKPGTNIAGKIAVEKNAIAEMNRLYKNRGKEMCDEADHVGTCGGEPKEAQEKTAILSGKIHDGLFDRYVRKEGCTCEGWGKKASNCPHHGDKAEKTASATSTTRGISNSFLDEVRRFLP